MFEVFSAIQFVPPITIHADSKIEARFILMEKLNSAKIIYDDEGVSYKVIDGIQFYRNTDVDTFVFVDVS